MYKITWGIHRGTLMSRDIGDPVECKTERKARQEFISIKKDMNSLGCQIWFAYLIHPDGYMDCVDEIDAKIVAVLHDVIEDTDQTIEGLRYAGFSDEIIASIDAITKRKDERLEDYWARVKANPLALRIKLIDITHNRSDKKLAALSIVDANYLRTKYDRARKFLMS